MANRNYVQIIASGCTFLAAKVEESFRNPEEIARNYYLAIGVQAVDDIKVSPIIRSMVLSVGDQDEDFAGRACDPPRPVVRLAC